MNTLKRFVWIGLAVLIVAASAPARAEVGDTYRLSAVRAQPGFSPNYIKDTTILCPMNLRAEFSGQGWRGFERINVIDYDVMLSLSPFEGLELGADMPVIVLQPDGDNEEHKGIGDVSAYIKYRLIHTEMIDLVGGFEFQANSAEQGEAVPCGAQPGQTCVFGVGANGYNPFLAVRGKFGDFAAGAHAGYMVFESPNGNVVNWDVNGIYAPWAWLGTRLELTGYNQVTGPSQDIIAAQAGVDFIFGRFTFRVGGAKGITDDAADWTLGGGAALTLGKDCEAPPPPPAAAAPPPPPPPPPPAKKRIVLRGVNFDFNKSDIRPVDVPVLEEAVSTLKAESLPGVTAIGYTDSVGSVEYNLKLSDRRAASVKNWLTAHGIPADKITAEGRGKSDPVASNETADGRAQNRRVELKVAE